MRDNKKITVMDGRIKMESKMSFRMICYYDKQCNMEFDPELMVRMGKLGLKLCVSCQEV